MRITAAEWMKLKVATRIADKFYDQMGKTEQYWVASAVEALAGIDERLDADNEKAAAHMREVRRGKVRIDKYCQQTV